MMNYTKMKYADMLKSQNVNYHINLANYTTDPKVATDFEGVTFNRYVLGEVENNVYFFANVTINVFGDSSECERKISQFDYQDHIQDYVYIFDTKEQAGEYYQKHI